MESQVYGIMKVLIISDIHGSYKNLQEVLEKEPSFDVLGDVGINVDEEDEVATEFGGSQAKLKS